MIIAHQLKVLTEHYMLFHSVAPKCIAKKSSSVFVDRMGTSLAKSLSKIDIMSLWLLLIRLLFLQFMTTSPLVHSLKPFIILENARQYVLYDQDSVFLPYAGNIFDGLTQRNTCSPNRAEGDALL